MNIPFHRRQWQRPGCSVSNRSLIWLSIVAPLALYAAAVAFAAKSSARATATLASWTLYLLRDIGFAFATAACPAAAALRASTVLPVIARAASSETQGTGATWPSTIRADSTLPPEIRRTAVAVA